MLNKVTTIVYIREMVLNQNKNKQQPRGANTEILRILVDSTSLLLFKAKQSLNKNRINIYIFFLINLI